MVNTVLAQRTLAIANTAAMQGNLPFGCLLANANDSVLLEAGNTVVTERNIIAHCELNMVQQLAGQYEASFLQSCTVYCSMEPCPMCAGALYWSGIGRIVFALDNATYYSILGSRNPADVFDMPCKTLLESGGRRVEVIGPVIQKEAADFYRSILKQ